MLQIKNTFTIDFYFLITCSLTKAATMFSRTLNFLIFITQVLGLRARENWLKVITWTYKFKIQLAGWLSHSILLGLYIFTYSPKYICSNTSKIACPQEFPYLFQIQHIYAIIQQVPIHQHSLLVIHYLPFFKVEVMWLMEPITCIKTK